MLSHIGSSAAQKFTIRIGFAFALGASITGCAVGPNYRRPTVNLQPFHNAPSIEARTASLAAPPLDQWWTGFHDPELTRIVKRTLDQNLDLAAAMTRVQQAHAAARGAGAQRLPSGNLSASTTTLYQSTESMTGRLASHLPGYNRTQNYYDLGFMASWEGDLFGGLKKGAEAATAEAQAAEAQHTGTRITVAAEAADAYMQIRGAQARLIFANDQIATDKHLVELVQQRRDAGVASDRELAQAQAVLSQAKATILETLAEPGQVVAAGQTVVKLAHSGPREAAVNLPETLRPAIGSTAYATLYGNTMKVPVRLRQLSDAADPQTRTFEARYVLESAVAKAPLGATVTVHLSSDAGTAALQIPASSIIDRGKGPGVWVVNKAASTVSFQPVQVNQLNEEVANISGTLQPGQEIVALGVHLLRDGERVRVEATGEVR